MKQIKVGVIGTGRMGQNHCRVYSGLRSVELIGVYDTNAATAAQVAQRFETKSFEAVDQLLDQVDAVSVTTPTPPHFSLSMHCLERGIHVLVEKPITETLEQARLLTEAAETCGRIVQVGHIERFNPTYIELKNVLENLPPLAINFRRLSPFKGSNTDVDVVMDLMSHDLDLILNLVNEEPELVYATGLRCFSDSIDHAVVQFVFPSIPVLTVTASRITEQKIRFVDAATRDSYVEGDLLNKSILIHRRTTGEYLNHNTSGVKFHLESSVERIMVPNVEPLASEIQHFVQCAMTGETPRVSARDGYRALSLAMMIKEKIYESERQSARRLTIN